MPKNSWIGGGANSSRAGRGTDEKGLPRPFANSLDTA
jgi:hypothetical protein